MRLGHIEWIEDKEFRIGDVRFLCALHDYSLRTDDERIVILKDKPSLEKYAELFSETEIKNVLEFGIWQGGSPALFSLWFDLEKFVGIDVCPPVEEFERFCATHLVGRKIRTHYGVSQTDRDRVNEIVRTEFGDAALDLVIDDASHLYSHSRRSFEIAFPRLRPGGIYVVEDWGWAHWQGNRSFAGQPALSILIMELVMLCASRPDLVSEVHVTPTFTFVRKSVDAPALEAMSLETLYTKRGLEIVSADRPNVRGIAKVFGQRWRARIASKARSVRKRLRPLKSKS